MKWYVYAICFLCTICGLFCGIRLFTEVTAKSYVRGSMEIPRTNITETFAYTNSSVVLQMPDLYDNSGLYVFTAEGESIPRVDNFDGARKQYEITLNDYILVGVEFSNGAIFKRLDIDFYDTDGNIVCSAYANISIKFLSSGTVLEISTTGDKNASFMQQYFNDWGFNLIINEIKGEIK